MAVFILNNTFVRV